MNTQQPAPDALNSAIIYNLNHSHTTASVYIRRAIENYREWIENKLGVLLFEAIILLTSIEFRNAAVPYLLGYTDPRAPVASPLVRLSKQIDSVEAPESVVPIVSVAKHRPIEDAGEPLTEESSAYSIDWSDGPVVLRLRDMPFPIVTLNVRYHAGPDSSAECEQEILIIPKHGLERIIDLLKTITKCDGKPKLKIGYEEQPVIPCDWDQLTLDPTVISLLKDDFNLFFKREAWFRRMGLPFRRGYLLHGPPGNGKTTAIRAMLTSRSLTAYTMRFFDKHADDNDLERIFRQAASNAPSMVLLEDVDRVFPRTGHSQTPISLQCLLNCLDGIASGEGIITVATANEPTALDQAVLRRPGRFDRVVLFDNPNSELRRQYFSKIDPSFATDKLDIVVGETEGMSFAQLREVHIMAGQAAYMAGREIVANDLTEAVWNMRRSLLFRTLKRETTGFNNPGANERSKRDRRKDPGFPLPKAT